MNWQPFIESGMLHTPQPTSFPCPHTADHDVMIAYGCAEFPDTDALQEMTISTPSFPATFLKVRITGGYHDFVSVRSFEVIA